MANFLKYFHGPLNLQTSIFNNFSLTNLIYEKKKSLKIIFVQIQGIVQILKNIPLRLLRSTFMSALDLEFRGHYFEGAKTEICLTRMFY